MNIAPLKSTLIQAVPIRRATPADIERIAAIFAAAFAKDPVFDWLTRNGAKREKSLERFFRWILGRTIAHGETWLDVDGLAAAAWIPPVLETVPFSFLEDLSLVPAVLRLTGVSRLPRGAAMAAAMERAHPQAPCFYLAFIGVAPRAQGAGLGSALIAHALARVDAAGANAYLENSNPRNIGLYERAGFKVTREIRARADAPTIFAMERRSR
ncbi:MAG TPA: N-acetyltransferase [Micropepsaceae bacterium]|nr:N-acetyltransferase [Micropepsaceae bacterium]